MKIILLRHGKPVIPNLDPLSASEFNEWVGLYNLSGLCPTSAPTAEAVTQARNCEVVVCSELPRSIESALALGIKQITFSDPQFNEAGLPIPKWNGLKLSPSVWAVFFRVLWLLGYSKNAESYKQAKARASNAASKLIAFAEVNESVLFVGHGVYNRLVANALRSKGWNGPKAPGNKHWSLGVYTQET